MNEAEREKERAETERERSDALYRVSNLLSGAYDTDEVLDLIVNESARLVGASGAYIRLVEGELLVPRAVTDSFTNTGKTILGVREGMMGHVMTSKQPWLAENLAEEEFLSADARVRLTADGFLSAAVVPLLPENRSLGVLSVFDNRLRRFTDDEVSLLSAFSDQAALALEKARLLNEAEREKERSDALYRVSNLLAGAHDTEEVLDLIVNEAARLLNASGAFIRLLDGDSMVASSATDSVAGFVAAIPPAVVIGQEPNILSHVIETKEPLVSENTADSDFVTPSVKDLMRNYSIRGSAVVPLLADNRPLGALAVLDQHLRRFTEDEVSLLTAFADQAALALEKARLLNEAERERERSDALYRVSNLLAGAHDTDEVLDLIVHEATRLVGATGAWMRLLEGEVLVIGPATETVAELLVEVGKEQPAISVEKGSTIQGRVMATKTPFFWVSGEPFAEGAMTPRVLSITQNLGFQKNATFPLVANDRSIGTLNVIDRRAQRFTDDEVSLLAAFADQASLAIEKSRLLNEAEARERQATQLYEVTTQLASNHDLTSVLDLITEQAVELMSATAAVLFHYDESKGGLVAGNTFNVFPEMPNLVLLPGEGIAGQAYTARRAMWTSDYVAALDGIGYSDHNIDDARRQVSDNRITSVISAPIVITDSVWGVLTLQFDKTRDFADEEVNLVQNLADSAAVAINNARFIAETEQARDEATQLYEITEQLASTTDMGGILDLIGEKAKELLRSDICAITRYDETKGGLVLPPAAAEVNSVLGEDYVLPLGAATAGQAYAERRPVWSQDYLVDESLRSNPAHRDALIEKLGLRAGLSVPIVIRDEAYGTLTVNFYETHEFTDREIQLLSALADSAAVAIGNARYIEETEQARDDAEEANRTKSQFLANMSHELRTPLNAIIGYSEMLQEDVEGLENEEFEDDLERINGAGKHLLGLINDVLDISKIEAGAMDIYLETFSVEPLIQDVATTMQTLVEKNSNTLKVECPDSVGSIHADTTKVRQGLFNLLSNASKFTEQGTISLKVSRESTDGRDWINFAVAGIGIGMNNEQMGMLFEAFAQAERSTNRRFGGTGLGLAITRHFCEMMGGTVLVESEEGKGSTFTMKLPAVVEDALGTPVSQ